MADCILRTQSAPAQGRILLVLYNTLRKLINCIWELEHFDNKKLAKYMRCLLKVTLPLEPNLPLKVIEETCDIVKESAGKRESFPSFELEWLATTAFNHGVDLYGINEDELSQKWVAHAFTLAHHHQDGGDLQRQLQEAYTKLQWGP
ncbi:Uu.00g068960.m01.CDS01 [Anthostomella pinea]|uniref:Uu.00g068960.m01.CDS01 n=1 Tax=Anthostomella pinea TaxID=933095 RepID=A0AAI8YNM7_9PEZI|nr:Uu.00g068960.m01.CDS01 [Anthostomella pinea]